MALSKTIFSPWGHQLFSTDINQRILASGYFLGDTTAELLPDDVSTVDATVGEGYEAKLPWSKDLRFNLTSGPVGMTVGNQTGTIRWTPTPDQTGEQSAVINNGVKDYSITFTVADAAISGDLTAAGWLAPHGLRNSSGTYNATTKAFTYSNDVRTFRGEQSSDGSYLATKTTIYMRGGIYIYDSTRQPITPGKVEEPLQAGAASVPQLDICANDGETIVIKPWGNERVMFRGGLEGTMSRVKECVKNIRFEGIEWRGESKFGTYEKVIPSWWQEEDQYNGNGIAIGGTNIEFHNCIFHEIMSQAMAAKQATNVIIKDCIVANSARWTISGTTGIGFVNMLASGDPVTDHSNQVDGCLIYGVESYLFSHVFSKDNVHLTIDEGEGLLAQPANQASVVSDSYEGRILFKNTALMHCGKGIVINGQPRCDIEDCTIFETGTTITGSSKAMRNNKATDNRWIRCAVNTVEGAGGEYGEAARFGTPSYWDGDTTYSKEGGGFLVKVPDDDQEWKLQDGEILDPAKIYLLNYAENRRAGQTPATLDRAEVALMVLRGEWIEPYLEDCYATVNEDDDKGLTGVTYRPTVFKTLADNTIDLSSDVTSHADYPTQGVGADASHIATLISRGLSYSVDLSPPTHWKDELAKVVDGLNGYQRQTKTILEQAEALGLTVDYSNWHNELPYEDAEGVSHSEFVVTVSDGPSKTLASVTEVNNQTSLTLSIVHPYPRESLED